MGNVIEFIKYHLRMTKFSLPSSIRIIDIVQILLIAIFVYNLMVWIKNTRAYTLLKGVLIVVCTLSPLKAQKSPELFRLR